jgi:hypothetical protein
MLYQRIVDSTWKSAYDFFLAYQGIVDNTLNKQMTVFRRVRKIAKSDFCIVVSVFLYVWNNSAVTGRIFMKFDMLEEPR